MFTHDSVEGIVVVLFLTFSVLEDILKALPKVWRG